MKTKISRKKYTKFYLLLANFCNFPTLLRPKKYNSLVAANVL